MNPEDYFKAGTEGYVQTKQAIDTINAGRAAGLPGMDQYENDLKASIALAKQSGWKQWKGFDATRQAIASIAPQVQSVVKKDEVVASKANSIVATIKLLDEQGVKTSPEEISNIANAAEKGDEPFLDQKANMLAAQLSELSKNQLPPTPAEQAKIDLDTQALNAAKQKELADKKEAENAKYSLEETLKDKYKAIMDIKKDPNIRSSFGIPFTRLIPGTDESALKSKVFQLASQEWIDSIIKSKAAGAVFGALSNQEGGKLASAATLLSSPSDLNYETANDELLKMAESVKKLYRKATGREIQEDLKLASPTPPDEMTPQQKVDAKAAELSGVLSGAPAQ
jgi:hypothetical protein